MAPIAYCSRVPNLLTNQNAIDITAIDNARIILNFNIVKTESDIESISF